ncbi:myocardin-like isoform X3 [Mobula hypostoma]
MCQDLGKASPSHPDSLHSTVLQLRLQNRLGKEQLSAQGTMPPQNGLPSFVEQRRPLERGKNQDSLQLKRHSPPLHPDLVQTDIPEGVVPDTANAKRKKTCLADDLGDAVLRAPELGEQKSLPRCPAEGQGLTASKWQIADSEDRSARMEDRGVRPVLPQQPEHFQSQETESSPRQLSDQITSSSGQSPQGSPRGTVLGLELAEVTPQGGAVCEVSAGQGQDTSLTAPTTQIPAVTTAPHSGPDTYRPQRPKKAKDGKPKVRKLKYHQYVPPDQKACEGPVAMDTAYLRLLRQQQLYLQLQILSQQQTPANQAAGLVPDGIVGFARALPPQLPFVPLTAVPKSPTAIPVPCCPRPELLPANLDDLTVSELRQQLRKRGLPVSGTKPALLERLKPYQLSGPKMAPPPLVSRPRSPPSTVRPALLEKQKVIERLTWKLRQEQPPTLAPHPPISASPFPGPALMEGQTESLPSPRNNFLLPSITDAGLLSPQPQPQEGSPLQPQDSSLCPPSEMQKACPDFPLSPASLHSFFPMEELDFESEFQGNFDREAFLSSDSRESGCLGDPKSTETGKFQTLEEELTQAIRSAELSQSPSIEEILNEPLSTTGPCARLGPDPPLSPGATRLTPIITEDEGSSVLLSPPSLDLLPELSHCRPFEPLSPPSSPGPCPPTASPPHSPLALDPADWVDASPSTTCPSLASVFCADMLEPPELGINRMVDLLVDQW